MTFRWNHRSDLILRESFFVRNNTGELEKIPIAEDMDFRIEYHTREARRFVASRIAGEYTNCRLLDTSTLLVSIPLSQNSLGMGVLCRKLIVVEPSQEFEKGTREICIPTESGIELWDGPSDANLLELPSLNLYPQNAITIGSLRNVKGEADTLFPEDVLLVKQKDAAHWGAVPLAEILRSASGGLDTEALAEYLTANKYATQTWVDNRYLKAEALSEYATQQWVQKQGYLTSHQSLDEYATQEWVQNLGYIKADALNAYATIELLNKKLDADIFNDFFEKVNIGTDEAPKWMIKTKYGFSSDQFVASKGKDKDNDSGSATTLGGLVNVDDTADAKATVDRVLVRLAGATHWTTKSLSDIVGLDTEALAEYLTTNKYATQQWVQNQGYLTSHQSLDEYATREWVQNLGYIKADALNAYATIELLNKKLDADIFNDFFEKVNIGTDEAPKWMIKTKYGFSSDQFVASKGKDKDNDSGSATALSQLTDVSLSAPRNGDVLQFNGQKWTNVAMSSLRPDLTDYATQTWVNRNFIQAINTDSIYLSLVKGDGTKTRLIPPCAYGTRDTVLRRGSANVNFSNDGQLRHFLSSGSMTEGRPMGDGHIVHMEWDNSLSWAGQLFLPNASSASMQWRTQPGSTWGAWRTLLDEANYAATLDGRYMSFAVEAGRNYVNASLSAAVGKKAHEGFIEFWDSAAGGWFNFKLGWLEAAGQVKAASFIRNGGTASQFLKADGSVDGTAYVNKAGDTLTGTLTAKRDQFLASGAAGIDMNNSDITRLNGLWFADAYNSAGEAINFYVDGSVWSRLGASGGTLYFNPSVGTSAHAFGHKVWHEGNDGDGSGLDADKLDGLHSTAFARCDKFQQVDLNTLNDFGFMENHTSADATTERHYPIQEAGLLIYGRAAYSSANQIYGSYYSNRWFARGGGWSTTDKTAWREFAFLDSNVASATKLATARKFWGRSTDWTNDVSGDMTGVGSISFANGASAANIDTYGNFKIGASGVRWTVKNSNNICGLCVLNSNGHVGINTEFPSEMLHVAGNILVSGDMTGVGKITTTTLAIATSYDHTWSDGTNSHPWYGYDHRYHNTGVYSTTISDFYGLTLRTSQGNISMNATGNVGIGTTSPTQKLHVADGNVLVSGEAYYRTEGRVGSSWNNGYGALSVGIMNNNSQTPLLVAYRYGDLNWTTPHANRLFAMELLNSGSVLRFAFGGAAKFYFEKDGTFHTEKGLWAAQYVSSKGASASSDIRLKYGLEPLTLTLEQIAAAPAVRYRWRDTGEVDLGSTSQYWLRILSEGVRIQPNGFYGMAYDKIALVSAILLARHALGVKNRVDNHETRIQKIEQKINQLTA